MLNQKQAIAMLGISRPTFNECIKRGEITPYIIDDKKTYDPNELQKMLQRIKRRKEDNDFVTPKKRMEVVKQDLDLNEIGNEALKQIVEDMTELGIDYKNFSIQLKETAIAYQRYKFFDERYMTNLDKESRLASGMYYKNFSSGLISLGLTPQAKKQLQGTSSKIEKKQLTIFDQIEGILND